MFKTGTKMKWKHNGKDAFEKLNDDDFGLWVSLDSKFLVETKVTTEVFVPKDKNNVNVEVDDEQLNLKDFVTKKVVETTYELKPETDKPLYRNGSLNRYGFKWTDNQVFEHYNSFMEFY